MFNNNNNRKEAYNEFSNLPELSYNAIAYLMQHDDISWRLLKYSDPNCLDLNEHPNLTLQEKADLVYTGRDNITDCRVFLDVGMDDAWTQEAAILRVSPMVITPDTYVYGKIAMSFEVYAHYKVNHLSNHTTRTVSLIQRLISVFNGSEIEGLGRLFFDARSSGLCRVVSIGRIPYKGMGLVMCNFLLG